MAKVKQRRPTGGEAARTRGVPVGHNGKVADAKLARWKELVAREPLLAGSEAAAVLAWWAHVDGVHVPADLFWTALKNPEMTPPSAILAALPAPRGGQARRAAVLQAAVR